MVFSYQIEDNVNLKELFDFGEISAEAKLYIFLEVLKSVKSLHEAGVVHCNLTENNFVWNCKRKRVCIINFEQAQLRNPSSYYKMPQVASFYLPKQFQDFLE
jgi:tRNA A-37 threonylcarbamoyl transferase component Bud32